MEITKRKTLTGSRYLSFMLDEEEYCIDILKIREIMGMVEITPIPQTPDFIQGVINLRGKIIPIIDLRLKFEMDYKKYTDRTCIIVIEIDYENEMNLMGVVVDSIQEVINIPEDKISVLPYINAKIKSEYIKGIAETGETIKIILDINKVLTEDDFVLLKTLNKTEKTNRTKKSKKNKSDNKEKEEAEE